MKIKLIATFLTVLAFATSADAITVVKDMWTAWGYDGGTTPSGSAGDFMLAGALGKNGSHGTHDDEWAVVGMVARTIVEHGGYFCPYQVQCANKRKDRSTWTVYYSPNGAGGVGCEWLCENGFSGHNCSPQAATPSTCEKKLYTKDGKFKGLSLKTSGGGADQKEGEVSGFNQWGGDPETDVILGIVKFLEHGVVAGPVQIRCGRNNWKDVDSYVESVLGGKGNQKILCATGYKANAAGSDCEMVSVDVCATEGKSWCDGFIRSGYDSSKHSMRPDGSCMKFFCTDTSKAFPKAGDYSCADCSKGVKGGSSNTNGTCVKCQTGEYFDGNKCLSATGYTKPDMQYGKGKTRNNTNVTKEQCWTMATPEEYKNCVIKGIVGGINMEEASCGLNGGTWNKSANTCKCSGGRAWTYNVSSGSGRCSS